MSSPGVECPVAGVDCPAVQAVTLLYCGMYVLYVVYMYTIHCMYCMLYICKKVTRKARAAAAWTSAGGCGSSAGTRQYRRGSGTDEPAIPRRQTPLEDDMLTMITR